MASQRWTVHYGPADRVEVLLETEGGRVKKFAVQYLTLLDQWMPIVRYDTAHGAPHRDVMRPDGTKDTKPIRGYDLEEVFEFALRDVEHNWSDYRERYERGRNR